MEFLYLPVKVEGHQAHMLYYRALADLGFADAVCGECAREVELVAIRGDIGM